MSVNKFRPQWENNVDDGFGTLMPITIYRVTWKDQRGEYCEYWTEEYMSAFDKKYEIDHSDGKMEYVNFESWFAYRSDEHDKRFGKTSREKGWWE